MVPLSPEFLVAKSAEDIFQRCTLADAPIYVSRSEFEAAVVRRNVAVESRGQTAETEAGPERQQLANGELSTSIATSPAAKKLGAKNWYIQRIEEWPANKRPPKAAEDEALLKKEFGVGREYARKLRKDHAPAEWHKPGADKQT